MAFVLGSNNFLLNRETNLKGKLNKLLDPLKRSLLWRQLRHISSWEGF